MPQRQLPRGFSGIPLGVWPRRLLVKNRGTYFNTKRKDMNAIKFSHEYPKLHGQTSAELLAVRPLKVDAHTPKKLLDYDTTYEGGRYPLRSGEYIQLIFLGNLRIPFCTIRSAYPPSKVAYYKQSVGKVFIIETPKLERCRKCAHYVDDATGCWLEDTPPDDCGNFLPEGGVP